MSICVQFRMDPSNRPSSDLILFEACRKAGLHQDEIGNLEIIRRSIDSRLRRVWVEYSVRLFEKGESPEPPSRFDLKAVSLSSPHAIIVGSGPAGLFAALQCLENSVCPVVLERGSSVEQRRAKITALYRDGVVDPDTNYCFGEGGAGTYSDGKLFTRSTKRGDLSKVLDAFVRAGADPSILFDAHPHLGSDRLPHIVSSIRQTIISCGGEFHFNSHVTDLVRSDSGTVIGVRTENGQEFMGPVILAPGHSAEDVYEFLAVDGIALQCKGIACGVRLEHPQALVDQMQYKDYRKYLPPAEYSFVTQVKGRGVYSFCMCPGGVIVPAVTQPDTISLNGMSASSRSGAFSNSAMVVEIRPEDLPLRFAAAGQFAMLEFVKALEKRTFDFSDGTLSAPAQLMGDFTSDTPSSALNRTSYIPGVLKADINVLLPPFISFRLQEALRTFGSYAHGFLTNDAMILASETRTSSPVRIVRNFESMMSPSAQGLFPSGEGAGYSGGIVSSALDGMNSAMAVSSYLRGGLAS